MEKKKIEISVSTLILFMLVVVLIMAIVILVQKNNQYIERIGELEESVIKLQLEDTQEKNVVVENEEDDDEENVVSTENTLNKESDKNLSNTVENVTIQKENTVKKTEKENNSSKNDEIVGRWNTYRAIERSTGSEITNLAEVFGSSIKFGSYLQLNEDGTFLNNIRPVTDGSYSVKGTYTIQNNYKKLGDCYVILNYDDGRTESLQKVYYDDTNIPSLSTEFNQGDIYQFDLKK